MLRPAVLPDAVHKADAVRCGVFRRSFLVQGPAFAVSNLCQGPFLLSLSRRRHCMSLVVSFFAQSLPHLCF